MTKILGLDIATKTGIAVYDPRKDLSAIEASSVTLKGSDNYQQTAQLGQVIHDLIEQHNIGFVAAEAPLDYIVLHKNELKMVGKASMTTASPHAKSTLALNRYAAAVPSICGVMGIPFVMIPSATWRKSFLGFGTKRGFERKDWKRAAKEKCRMLGIQVRNGDEAEACGVAIAAPFTPEFKMMEYQKRAA